MSTKAELKRDRTIPGFIEARRELLDAAAGLSPDARDDVFLGTWSVKDLLAHLVGWDYTNLEAAQEILNGKQPSFLSQYDRDWQTYNAALVKRYRRDDWEEQLSSVDESHRLLVDFLQSLPVEELDRDRGLRVGRFKVTLVWLMSFETYDERRHARQVRSHSVG